MRKLLEILEIIAGAILAIIAIALVVGSAWVVIQVAIDVLNFLYWLGTGDILLGGGIAVTVFFGLLLIVLFGF